MSRIATPRLFLLAAIAGLLQGCATSITGIEGSSSSFSCKKKCLALGILFCKTLKSASFSNHNICNASFVIGKNCKYAFVSFSI